MPSVESLAIPGIVVGTGALVTPGGLQGPTGATIWAGATGRLGIASSPSNTISFFPYKGDLIKIAGSIYNIPAAGVSATANNLYLNGVPGSSLAAQVVYNVYVFNNAGTLTLDFSTTTHAVSSVAGNEGTEIKSGDNTRSFVGLVYTSSNAPSSNSFYDQYDFRYIASWFNRRGVSFSWYGSLNIGGLATKATFVNLLFKGDSVTATGTWFGTGASSDNLFLRLYDGPSGSFNQCGVTTIHTTAVYANMAITSGGIASADGASTCFFQANSQSGGNVGNGTGSLILNQSFSQLKG
jgi:hypothetical protein